MKITEEKYRAYEAVRRSGLTNMFDVRMVCELSDLAHDEVLDIMKNYSGYKEEFEMDMEKRSGTSFQGYLYVEYNELVEKFGKPHGLDSNHKIDAEWIVDTPHGVATIYNYKNGYSYLGLSGLKLNEMDEWHVGGKNKQSYEWITTRLSTKL